MATAPPGKARYAPREGRACASQTWGPRHQARAEVVTSLLQAGGVARRWACGERYTSGPCVGLEVVDPWALARRVGDCCSELVYHATGGGSQGGTSVSPARCGAKHSCPVCAAAAATKRAEGIRVVGARAGRPGALVVLVLTHRDREPGAETCVGAWARWEGAYQRLRTGEHGKWLRSTLYGGSLNLETTGGATGASWHPHAHGLVELHELVDPLVFREELARRWAECTALAAGDPELGWSRASGFDDSGRERWCELLSAPLTSSPSEEEHAAIRSACYQVAKYPSPIADLRDPERMAQFVTWANKRHLSRWLGAWGRGPVQEWIREAVRYEAEEERKRRVVTGDAPDTGPVIRGLRPVAAHELPDEADTLVFLAPGVGVPVLRERAGAEWLREWWRMAGRQHRLTPVLVELVTEERAAELQETFRELRKRADIESALAAWRALQEAEYLGSWTDDRLNEWHARKRRERIAARSPR